MMNIQEIKDQVDVMSKENFRELTRELCRNNLEYLSRNILNFKDWDECHDDFSRWYDTVSGNRFRLILMPRGHLKTSIITIAQTIKDILNDFDTSILLASAVWNNSRSYLRELKTYLTSYSELSLLFGVFQSEHWNQEEIVIRQRLKPNKTPTVDTAGIEKTLTSQHYKIIRADDLVTRENITTRDQIDKVINYFKDLIKLLEPDGIMDIIGTRWNDRDLYGYIIRELSKVDG